MKVHCFFEQSGTFKNEFKKLEIEAIDYDILNEFNQTDNIIDLYKEIEKPNQFNIKTTKFDNKFDKVYNEMMRKEENIKSKINAFADMVQKYEMRECVFQPNLYKYNNKKDGNNKIKRRVSSCDITKRLYDEEIKNRRNRINKLNEKYKLTFKPKISNKSVDLALKRREKIKLLSKEDTKEEDDNSNSNNIKNL